MLVAPLVSFNTKGRRLLFHFSRAPLPLSFYLNWWVLLAGKILILLNNLSDIRIAGAPFGGGASEILLLRVVGKDKLLPVLLHFLIAGQGSRWVAESA